MRTLKQYTDWGFEVHSAESPAHAAPAPFNLAAARNHLVRGPLAGADVMILSDADTLPDRNSLEAAIYGASYDGFVHLPYHLYRDEHGTFVDGATSGVYVFEPAAWEATNGQDEKFNGWGYEDAAWRLAHLTLRGPVVPHRGTVVAAGHDPAPRDHVAANRRRYRLYQEAFGDPVAMQDLVDGWSPADQQEDRIARAHKTARASTLRRRGITT